MNIVGVVACSSKKLPYRAAAQDLYIGPLFRLSREWITQRATRWVILSGLYGVVEPGQEIATYNLSLKSLSASDLRKWQDRVREDLEGRFPGATYLTTAGSPYRAALPPERTICPWADLPRRGIGSQLQFLRQQLDHPTWRPELIIGR